MRERGLSQKLLKMDVQISFLYTNRRRHVES